MKKGKILISIVMFTLVLTIGMNLKSVYATNNTVEKTSSDNWFKYAGDHTYNAYKMDDYGQGWCIEPGVGVKKTTTYSKIYQNWDDTYGESTRDKLISYYILSDYDNQIKQAAIWEACGATIEENNNEDQYNNVIKLKNEAHQHVITDGNGTKVTNGQISTETLTFSYNDDLDSFVSDYFTVTVSGNGISDITLSGAPDSAYFEEGSAKLYGFQLSGGQSKMVRVVVPADDVENDITVTANVSGSGSGTEYLPCLRYHSDDSQDLAQGKKQETSGSGASASGFIEASAQLTLYKEDEHGKPVQGAEFKITGPASYGTKTFYTDENGLIDFGRLKVGNYTIEETKPGQNQYISVDAKNISFKLKGGKATSIDVENEYKRGKVQLDKFDMDYEKDLKGDCKLEGAIYRIVAEEDIYEGTTLLFKADEEIPYYVDGKVTQIVTDRTGKTPVINSVYSYQAGKALDGIPIGNYYWEELEPSEGFNINNETVHFEIDNNGNLDEDKYKEELAQIDATQGEKLVTGRGLIIKYDNGNKNGEESSEKNASEGAVLRIRLVSAIGTDKEERNTYTATIDENGYCEFKDQEYLALHPGEIYTIPYGRYELTEIKESKYGTHTYYYTQTEYVTISENHQVERRIVADEPLTVHLMLIKKDKVSGMDVHISGGKYKIWDCQKDEFVTQMKTPSGEMIDTFETNELGYFITPQKLYAGEYIVYEIEAPKGYYLDDEYRLPENPEDYGDITKGGAYVKIDKQAVGIAEDTQAPLTGEPDLIYEVEIANRPLKGKIEVEKTGEMLTEYNEYDKIAEFEDGEKMTYKVTTPVYKFKGLANVEYTIEAKEDIKSPDGRYTYEGAHSVKHKIRTDENGYAITDELYLGTYEITETETPLGYVTDTDIDDITLENDNQLERIKTTIKELQNIKQKTELDVEKEFEDSIYDFGKIKVVLGIYTKQDLKANGTDRVVIKQDTLLDVVYGEVEPGETINLTSDVNVPAGTYYVQELYVDYPYELSDKKYEFTVSHKNTIDEKVNIKIPKITNEIIKGSLSVVKLSANSLINEEDQPLVGGKLTEEQIDRNLSDLVNWMRATEPNIIRGFLIDENLEYDDIASTLEKEADKRYMLELASTKLYSGAIYGIYLDKDCKEPLKYKNGTNVVIETNRKGYGEAENMPIGEYWLQEIKAPSIMIGEKEFTYDVDKEIKHVTLPLEDKDKITFNAFCDTIEVGDFLTKYDIFTGELVPDCIFMIQDKDGKIIVEATTNEKGLFELPIEWFEYGETYTYTEIEAPEEYNIDTTPHEFTIEFDENGDLIKVEAENTRKTRKVIVRKLDADTSEPLEGCIFTIALIDEETGEQMVNQRTGEAIYLVENATTDENGEYVIDEAPMGTYRFTEIKAPEGYELDEDLTGYEFTINNDSPETIIFEVTNTGDIAVVAIACIGLVCVVGIVYIMRKRIFVK